MSLDYSVFPDVAELPDHLHTAGDRADYLARVCGAWDFGVAPTPETFALFRGWQAIFDTFPVRSSPAYVAFRMLYRWPDLECGRVQVARYERIDARSRAIPDPCAEST